MVVRIYKNKKSFGILLLEFTVLLFFVIRCFGSCVSYTLGKDSLEKGFDGELTYFDDDFVGIEKQGTDETEFLKCSLELRPGAYDINIIYESITDYESISTDNSAGYIQFSTDNSRVLKANNIYLHDGLDHASSRMWIRMGGGTNLVNMAVRFGGNGKLAIKSITINEKREYRVANCIAILLFLIGINLFYDYFVRRDDTQEKRRKRYIIAGVVAITVFASSTYFADYLFINWGHDLHFHLSRIVSLADALKEFQIPQRIQFGMLNGYGYATPLYYGEIFLLIPAVLYDFYIPLQTCYQIFAVCVNLATCVISYWCFFRMLQDYRKGMLGAFIYTVSSYRLTNMMVRAAVGEYTALAFYPLMLYGLWILYNKETNEKIKIKDCMSVILSATGIINSHTLSCLMLLVFVIPFVLLNYKRTFRKNILSALIKIVVTTLMLNLWFVVPFLQSMTMNTNIVMSRSVRKMERSCASLAQIFGIFHTASGADIAESVQGEMPLSLGVALVIGIVIFALLYINKEIWQIAYDRVTKTAVWCFAFGVVAVFLSSDLCKWDNLRNLNESLAWLAGKIQFPWRYLGMATVFFTTMTICLLQIIEKYRDIKYCYRIMLVIITAVVLTEGAFITDYINVQSEIKIYSRADIGTAGILNIVGGEYLLRKTDGELYKDPSIKCNHEIDIVDFHYERNGKYYLTYINNSSTDSYADLPVQGYDNYHAYDEVHNELMIEQGENSTIRVMLPKNSQGMISLEYKVPLLWRICECISCITACIMIWIIIQDKKRLRMQ